MHTHGKPATQFGMWFLMYCFATSIIACACWRLYGDCGWLAAVDIVFISLIIANLSGLRQLRPITLFKLGWDEALTLAGILAVFHGFLIPAVTTSCR